MAQTTKYVFSLPTWGAPYIAGVLTKDNQTEHLEILQKVVMGDIEGIPPKSFVLHPMFCSENKRWNALRQMLTSKKVKVYINEDGYNKHLQANMATILLGRTISGCPHLLGNICVVVPQSVLTALGYTENQFSLVIPQTILEEDEYPVWEFDDDEEMERQKAIWDIAYPNNDWNEDTGYCYKSYI